MTTRKIVGGVDIRNGVWNAIERISNGADKGTVAGTGVTVVESLGKTVITLTSVSIATVDAGAAGAQGTLKVYDFPEGLLHYVGGVTNLTLVKSGSGIAATSTVIASVGTVAAAADLTLTGTEADLVPSASVTLSAGAGAIKGVSVTGGIALLDGTATAKDAILNLVVDATGSTANAAIVVSGTITLMWSLIADK